MKNKGDYEKHFIKFMEVMTMTTTNLSEFGYRELEMVRDLLSAMIEDGLPRKFYDEEVCPMMNKNSGSVFLTNSECQVAMMHGGKLKMWYFLSYHGNEGFADDLWSQYQDGYIQSEDWEQLADILDDEGMSDEAEKVREAMEE